MSTTMSGKEFREKFRNIIFVKLLNETRLHNNYQFVEGLNECPEPFNANPDCAGGGFYFCDKEKMACWFSYRKTRDEIPSVMIHMCSLYIPDDAIVSVGNLKFKTNKFILGKFIPFYKYERESKYFHEAYITMLKNFNSYHTLFEKKEFWDYLIKKKCHFYLDRIIRFIPLCLLTGKRKMLLYKLHYKQLIAETHGLSLSHKKKDWTVRKIQKK